MALCPGNGLSSAVFFLVTRGESWPAVVVWDGRGREGRNRVVHLGLLRGAEDRVGFIVCKIARVERCNIRVAEEK